MKVAHFSDLHICALHRKDNIQFTRDTLEYVLKADCDHVVITGDLSHMGSHRDFEILRTIFEDYNLLDPNRLSLTIGNHDIFGGVQLAEDVLEFPQRCKAIHFNQKTREFVEFFRECFDNVHRLDQRHFFPFAKPVKDIVLFGVNSCIEYSLIKNPMASNGHVSKAYRKLLTDLMSLKKYQNKLKIVLIHHHFYRYVMKQTNGDTHWWDRIEHQTMKLYKKKKLQRLFSQHGVHLVLHGHVHEYRQYEHRGVVFLNGAGWSTPIRHHALEVNIICTEGTAFEIQRHRFPYTRKKTVVPSGLA
jgi:3',5'-cyclic AMP phosphodiesterase CpdA